MRPIIKWTLWQRRWSILWWCLGIALFVVLELSVYNSVKSQAAQLNEALSRLPGSVRSLFGANTDLFSPVGYLNSRLFYLLLPLLLSILTIGLGSSLLAREESDGTLELLLSRPISRGRLLAAKAFGGLLVTFIILAISTLVIMAGVKIVGLAVPLTYVAFAAMMAGLIAVLFGSIALLVTAIGKRGRGAAIGIACLIGFGGYILTSLEADVHWLRWPARLLPYHYYNPTTVLNGDYTWAGTIGFSVLIVAIGFLSWLGFRRRDLNG